MRLAVLFSGQGAQTAKHLAELRADAVVAQALDSIARPLDAPAAQELADNTVAQTLISALHAARWRRLAPRLPRPLLLAGYSLGELSAFAIARGLPLHDWLDVAARRARWMNAAAPGDGGLLAVQGLDERTLLAALRGHAAHIAIRNGDTHFVVGAAAALLDTFERTLPAQGARRCVRLAVHTPSHTPLLAAAQAPLAEALAALARGPLAVPVIAGIDGRVQHRATDAARTLAAQVAHRVDWAACMDTLLEYAPDAALEIGPGNALSKMLAERAPHLPARSIDDFSGDTAACEWVARHAP